jgi:hypothetical protein
MHIVDVALSPALSDEDTHGRFLRASHLSGCSLARWLGRGPRERRVRLAAQSLDRDLAAFR